MREEEIKKKAEEYESKFTYSLATSRHFEDGAKWALSQPQIIEIFGKRVKIVSGDGSANDCMSCALYLECDHTSTFYLCKSADEKFNRHFVEVDEDGNEIKQLKKQE